jgi:hypothetical protein
MPFNTLDNSQDEPSYQLHHLDMLLAASAYGRTELLWYMQHVGEEVPVPAKGAMPLFQAATAEVVEADCQVLLLLAALVRVYEGLVSGLAAAEGYHNPLNMPYLVPNEDTLHSTEVCTTHVSRHDCIPSALIAPAVLLFFGQHATAFPYRLPRMLVPHMNAAAVP